MLWRRTTILLIRFEPKEGIVCILWAQSRYYSYIEKNRPQWAPIASTNTPEWELTGPRKSREEGAPTNPMLR